MPRLTNLYTPKLSYRWVVDGGTGGEGGWWYVTRPWMGMRQHPCGPLLRSIPASPFHACRRIRSRYNASAESCSILTVSELSYLARNDALQCGTGIQWLQMGRLGPDAVPVLRQTTASGQGLTFTGACTVLGPRCLLHQSATPVYLSFSCVLV